MTDLEGFVRMLVEECWSDAAGVVRMGGYTAPDYVHHTPNGDWTFEQFKAGMAWVDTVFAERRYRAQHIVVGQDLVAAFVLWTATRVVDGTPRVGRGAYHGRVTHGLLREDWDVFVPIS